MAASFEPGLEVGLATSVFTPGPNRLAFGLIDASNSLVYGRSAVYVAPGPTDKAQGPFPAPTDSLLVDPPYRSQTAAHEEDPIAAIYSTTVPLRRPGRYSILTVTRSGRRLLGARTRLTVSRDSPVPRPGERPPAVETETVASAGGDLEAIDTRVPPSDMHARSFREVLGKRPVALLFATPQLCQSRVCGPVVDIAAQLKATYGDRVEFIHQEVYANNDVGRGLRAPLRAFGLQTEPWLFTVDRQGRVAARLEGSFGVEEFRRAVEAALR